MVRRFRRGFTSAEKTESYNVWAMAGRAAQVNPKNHALFGPVERQVLPMRQPAPGGLRRLLAFQDGRDDIGREGEKVPTDRLANLKKR